MVVMELLSIVSARVWRNCDESPEPFDGHEGDPERGGDGGRHEAAEKVWKKEEENLSGHHHRW